MARIPYSPRLETFISGGHRGLLADVVVAHQAQIAATALGELVEGPFVARIAAVQDWRQLIEWRRRLVDRQTTKKNTIRSLLKKC